ncbi:SEC-C metal-binding domain-containing protein [Pseudomonas aeruginosa]|uniref:SEC-C metal-binding domain-containing protein n=1 Tax=Pseudomonas aeruginosa TaxID=287 RepID=UPI000B0D4343|nr:SEC-C metal-binding domain-containing protein [Pseudomonas aeruginosa]
MNIRREMTDVELCISLVPEAGEHYRRALDVVSAYPDYAKTQFRIVVEHLTYMLARRFRVEVGQVALFEAINELYACQVINNSLRSDLHAIRKAGNAVVHLVQQQGTSTADTSVSNSKDARGGGDLQSALDARKILVGIFESVFLLLNRGEKLPAITAVDVGDFTSQQTLWRAATSIDYEAKLAAGLILEAQSMAPISGESLVIGYSEDAHKKTTLRMAAELYWAACEISAGLDRFSLSEIHLKGGKEPCLFKLANTEALYRYARITFDKNEGEESNRLGLKAMEVAAKRGNPSACALYGDHLRQKGQFNEALVMLEESLSKGDITAHAGLALLYLEKESPFYSIEKAEQCLQNGIARDCHHSEYLLGRWLYEGHELIEDKDRGLKLLEAAAESGHWVAQRYIDFCVDDRFAKLLQQNFMNVLTALGPQTDSPKQGRNESCSCGSGKKYKKCCGA